MIDRRGEAQQQQKVVEVLEESAKRVNPNQSKSVTFAAGVDTKVQSKNDEIDLMSPKKTPIEYIKKQRKTVTLRSI